MQHAHEIIREMVDAEMAYYCCRIWTAVLLDIFIQLRAVYIEQLIALQNYDKMN